MVRVMRPPEDKSVSPGKGGGGDRVTGRKRTQIHQSNANSSSKADADGGYWRIIHKKKSLKEISFPLGNNDPPPRMWWLLMSFQLLPCAMILVDTVITSAS